VTHNFVATGGPNSARLSRCDQRRLAVRKIAIAFKESRRLWFRDRLKELGVTNADALATQLVLLVDGSIARDLVRDDPAMARAAKDAARALLVNAGVKVSA
jgi:hypothetical protein